MPTPLWPEYVWSKYHPWFVEMGHPLLDVNQYQDGEWAIIQWFTRPVIPSITQCQNVLSGMKNVEISKGFCAKYLKELDITRKQFWDREDAVSKKASDEHEARDAHAEDLASAATKAILGNEDLCERIAKNGIEEIHPLKIAKHIPYNAW